MSLGSISDGSGSNGFRREPPSLKENLLSFDAFFEVVTKSSLLFFTFSFSGGKLIATDVFVAEFGGFAVVTARIACLLLTFSFSRGKLMAADVLVDEFDGFVLL